MANEAAKKAYQMMALGRLPAATRDAMGDTLGSFSGMALEPGSWRARDGGASGVFVTLPDRGFNIPEKNRVQQLSDAGSADRVRAARRAADAFAARHALSARRERGADDGARSRSGHDETIRRAVAKSRGRSCLRPVVDRQRRHRDQERRELFRQRRVRAQYLLLRRRRAHDGRDRAAGCVRAPLRRRDLLFVAGRASPRAGGRPMTGSKACRCRRTARSCTRCCKAR